MRRTIRPKPNSQPPTSLKEETTIRRAWTLYHFRNELFDRTLPGHEDHMGFWVHHLLPDKELSLAHARLNFDQTMVRLAVYPSREVERVRMQELPHDWRGLKVRAHLFIEGN